VVVEVEVVVVMMMREDRGEKEKRVRN